MQSLLELHQTALSVLCMGHLAREWSVPYITVAEILTLKCFFRPITPGKISSRAKFFGDLPVCS